MAKIYRSLIALHPAAFRLQFGPEMELIFDEAGRPARLLADVFLSLGRQWVLRTQIWIFALAAVGGTIPFALGFGFLRLTGSYFGLAPTRRHAYAAVVPQVSEPVTEPIIMMSAVMAVMFISGTMILAIAWFRYYQRRRQA